MASTAADVKRRFKTLKPITVPLPGTDLVFECRKPDLVHMVLSGFMTWPALQRVREITAQLNEAESGNVIDNRPLPTLRDRAEAVCAMLDEFVCEAVVSPRVVLRADDEDDGSIWVGVLPFPVRKAIFDKTFSLTPDWGATFRGDESGSAPPGQDGAPVRDETLVAVGND